jgi:XTP/dITP diphosphohydrolase
MGEQVRLADDQVVHRRSASIVGAVPRLLLGTTNAAKIREYRRLLGDLPIELISPSDPPPVPETGATFQENALLKAHAYAAWSGLPSLADDGGIEIDALDGEPGIHSARWLGRAATDQELIAYTLERMNGVPPDRRGAQMRAVCALVQPLGGRPRPARSRARARAAAERSDAGTGQGVTIGEGVMRGILREVAVPFEPGFPYRALFVASSADPFRHREEALIPIRLRLLTDLIGCANP